MKNWILWIKRPHAGSAAARVALCVLVVATYALVGCSEDPGGQRVENLPPTVWLSSAPPEGDPSKYRIQLFWGGWDPDGEIAFYEYAITDNVGGTFNPDDTTTVAGEESPWHRVLSNDSLFTFTADVWADSNNTDDLVSRFERSHTFFVRAVDEEGMASKEPAYRSFTAWTLSPSARIQIPRATGLTPALVPAIATYRWTARDFVNSEIEIQDPDSVRYILVPVAGSDYDAGIDYVREHPDADEWSDWQYYRAPDDSGKFWTTPPTDFGEYVFAVQAKDEAGAVTPVFDDRENVRRIRVSARSSGPILDVFNEFVGTIRTSVVNSPTVFLDMPAGVPMGFSIRANADHYGGLVAGYRYGWDIADLDDPDQWEVDYTPFTSNQATVPPRTFFFGSHIFNAEVIDNSGARSRVEIKVNVVQFNMSRSVLLVDDYAPLRSGIVSTKGAVPNDEEHDAFWEDMLEEVAGFDIVEDQLTVIGGEPMSIVKFSNYKSVVWDALGGYNTAVSFRPKLYDLIQFRSKNPESGAQSGKVQPNLLALFVQAGGHLFLCGNQPLTQSITTEGFFSSARKYPFIFEFELEGDQDGDYSDQEDAGSSVGDRSFIYQDACVNVLDIAYYTFNEVRTDFDHDCGVEQLRGIDPKNDGLRAALPLDASFPRLELRPEVANPGKAYSPAERGLNAELYNPPYFEFCVQAKLGEQRDCFQPVYGNGCADTTSVLYNAPVAFWGTAYKDIVPELGGGGAGRSFYLGVDPYYFKPEQAEVMMRIILFDEWGLVRL